MKKGFTLMEMMAVILIISIISMVVVPQLYNQIANKKQEIDSATKQIIYTGAKLYLNNHESEYTKDVPGTNYCITLDTLVNQGIIDSKIIDYNNGQEIPLSKGVRTTINQFKDYDNFEIVDRCN